MSEKVTNVGKQIAIASPSVAALAVEWLNVPVTEWAARLGLVFLILQIGYLIWKWRKEAKQ